MQWPLTISIFLCSVFCIYFKVIILSTLTAIVNMFLARTIPKNILVTDILKAKVQLFRQFLHESLNVLSFL